MTVAPLVLVRHFKAPPERVFAAFTEKALMQGWFGPEPMTVPHCDVDARVGGKYRVEMHAANGSVHIVTGEFKEIVAPKRLVFSWGWLNGTGRNPETTVTVTLAPRDGGTELRLEQVGFASEEFRQGHNSGWTSSLNSLDAALEGRPKAPTPGPVVIGDSRSSYTRAARIAFFEKGVAHAHRLAVAQSPEMLAYHPYGKMPALRLGENSLYECSAILRYVDEAYPGPALMPADPLARAKAEQWISVFKDYFYDPVARRYVLQYLFPRGGAGQPDRATIEAAIPDIRRTLDLMEVAYGGEDYLVGGDVSLADILFAPSIDYLGMFPEGAALLAERPNVKRAHAAFVARPSFVAATAAS